MLGKLNRIHLGTAGRGASSGTETKLNKRFSARPSSRGATDASPSPEELSPPSLGRLSQGRLLLRILPGLAGARMEAAAEAEWELPACETSQDKSLVGLLPGSARDSLPGPPECLTEGARSDFRCM